MNMEICLQYLEERKFYTKVRDIESFLVFVLSSYLRLTKLIYRERESGVNKNTF